MQPAIEPLGNDRFRIGVVVIDRQAREVRIPAAMAIREGTLEYLACAPGGKLYESLLRIDADPYYFHVALLLIGLEPMNNLARQGDPRPPAGDHVTIEVIWRVGGQEIVRRAEDLIWDRGQNRPMTRTTWAFTGSHFARGVFAASVTKSLVAVYADHQAILNNPLQSRGDDSWYTPYTKALPPADTPLEVVIRAAQPTFGPGAKPPGGGSPSPGTGGGVPAPGSP